MVFYTQNISKGLLEVKLEPCWSKVGDTLWEVGEEELSRQRIHTCKGPRQTGLGVQGPTEGPVSLESRVEAMEGEVRGWTGRGQILTVSWAT